jgi:uncharacterized coiled-coil protein SlyX
MADVTLHRAGRFVEAVRAAIGRIEFAATARISIFGEPMVELGRQSTVLSGDIDKLERLLAIQARIRSAVGRANAELGIDDLLAEKAAAEEWIKLVSPLVAKGASNDVARVLMRRHPADPADVASLEARATAMRTRFAAADGQVESAIDVRLFDDDATVALSKRIAERRRDIERLSDRLREINARPVALDQQDLDDLASADVI